MESVSFRSAIPNGRKSVVGDSKKRDEIKAVLAEGVARGGKAATRSEKREVQRYSRTEFA